MIATETNTGYVGADTSKIDRACPTCGLHFTLVPYAHGTCSQLCACTAAIVEAINGWRIAGLPTWRVTGEPPQREIDPTPGPVVYDS